MGAVSVYVRTALDPEEFLATLPRVVARIDPNLPLENLRTMPQQVRQNVFLDRFISLLSAAFACLATLLAAIGLYGVLAYTVAQRTREIGLRMALGAAPSRVRGMVLRQVALMTLVGGAIGLGGAVWLARLAESLLYELKGHDPVGAGGRGRRAVDRRADCRLHPGAPRLAGGADARAPLRIGHGQVHGRGLAQFPDRGSP